ncbi:hypothetical protein CCACVL1_07575 [Corchorus capsularis]|uniref:RING-type E3 ubiquitin transferase n=1 Tax=Corchorus capsularis TaxID=210143 RepID=A0A1R3J549_COCAP|nr:hypothetical protein CCACVL1_07575 [Corchorus capsularis]
MLLKSGFERVRQLTVDVEKVLASLEKELAPVLDKRLKSYGDEEPYFQFDFGHRPTTFAPTFGVSHHNPKSADSFNQIWSSLARATPKPKVVNVDAFGAKADEGTILRQISASNQHGLKSGSCKSSLQVKHIASCKNNLDGFHFTLFQALPLRSFCQVDSEQVGFIHQKKVLRGFDEEIRDFVGEQMALRGIEFHTEETPQAIVKAADGSLSLKTNSEIWTNKSAKVIEEIGNYSFSCQWINISNLCSASTSVNELGFLSRHSKREDIFPLVIFAEAGLPSFSASEVLNQPPLAMSSHAQITQAVLKRNNEEHFQVQVIKQILRIEGIRYELREIYGIENSIVYLDILLYYLNVVQCLYIYIYIYIYFNLNDLNNTN